MIDFIVYPNSVDRPLTNPYMRIVRVADGKVYDKTAKDFSATVTWANSAIILAKDAVIGGIPIEIPETVESGSYDVCVYDSVNPLATDDMQLGKRVIWDGKQLMYLPLDI